MREREWFVVPPIYAFSGCFLYVPWQGIEPATLVYPDDALTTELPGHGLFSIGFCQESWTRSLQATHSHRLALFGSRAYTNKRLELETSISKSFRLGFPPFFTKCKKLPTPGRPSHEAAIRWDWMQLPRWGAGLCPSVCHGPPSPYHPIPVPWALPVCLWTRVSLVFVFFL